MTLTSLEAVGNFANPLPKSPWGKWILDQAKILFGFHHTDPLRVHASMRPGPGMFPASEHQPLQETRTVWQQEGSKPALKIATCLPRPSMKEAVPLRAKGMLVSPTACQVCAWLLDKESWWRGNSWGYSEVRTPKVWSLPKSMLRLEFYCDAWIKLDSELNSSIFNVIIASWMVALDC